MMIRMQKARGLNIADGKWKKRFNIITSEVARILTPRTSFPSAHNVNGCQGSFPSSFWCGEGHPTVALAGFELASDGTIQGHWLPLQKLCVLLHSAQMCYCRQQSQPKSTPLNLVQIWSGTAANSARIRIKESIFCCVTFFNVLGFFRDEWCFMYSLYDGFSVLHVCSLYEEAFGRGKVFAVFPKGGQSLDLPPHLWKSVWETDSSNSGTSFLALVLCLGFVSRQTGLIVLGNPKLHGLFLGHITPYVPLKMPAVFNIESYANKNRRHTTLLRCTE